jgi:hypothetical protein
LTPSPGVQVEISVQGKSADPEALARELEEAARKLREAAPRKPAPAVPSSPAGLLLPAPDTGAAPCPEAAAEPPRHQETLLPSTLLYTPPIANLWSPRTFVMPTTLHNQETSKTIDTGIGGEAGLFRWNGAEHSDEAVQLDFFAVVFSRWANARESVGVDYRFGFPVTFAWGPLSGKVGFEHTSTHLGDEFIDLTGRRHQDSQRNEIAMGLAYQYSDAVRVYAQSGYAFVVTNPTPNRTPDRWDVGLEWNQRCATGLAGNPFAAVDLEFRGDENYHANFSAQAGWQWRGYDRGPAARLALEYYNGQSPFGQFIAERESWLGVILSFGF